STRSHEAETVIAKLKPNVSYPPRLIGRRAFRLGSGSESGPLELITGRRKSRYHTSTFLLRCTPDGDSSTVTRRASNWYNGQRNIRRMCRIMVNLLMGG